MGSIERDRQEWLLAAAGRIGTWAGSSRKAVKTLMLCVYSSIYAIS